VHFDHLTSPEQRVLGCLIEKRWTTPDQYPLSLNALRLACNQSTNRDPVTRYDESTVREAAQRLCRYGLARLASGHSSRAIKYRHLAEEALSLGREELAVLAVMLLRGPQTPGELKARSERMARLDSLEEVDLVLSTLIERRYARRLDRRPGQKEDRYEQLLGGGSAEDGGARADYGADYGAVAAAPAMTAQPGTSSAPTSSPPVGAPAGTGERASVGAPAGMGGTAGIGVPADPDAPPRFAPVGATTTTSPPSTAGIATDGQAAELTSRLGDLEVEVALLRDELDALRTELAALRDPQPEVTERELTG
jgi:uncharacterized protein YceH (UPF0502 family)